MQCVRLSASGQADWRGRGRGCWPLRQHSLKSAVPSHLNVRWSNANLEKIRYRAGINQRYPMEHFHELET